MGQVLGFSHCKEFGSVSSTPDSTPPCTDGGNEESDFPELQTAREWSDDEDGIDDEEGGASSPSVWGTPRQNSFELTFSYIAFSEPDLGGASVGGARRRAWGRGGRTALGRTDSTEAPPQLDSPQAEWVSSSFLPEETETEVEREDETEGAQGEAPQPPSSLELGVQSPPPTDLETEELEEQCEESSQSQQHRQSDSEQVLCAGESSVVAMETMDTLLVAMQPGGGITDVTSSTSSSSIGQSSQEEPGSELLFSELSLSEDTTQWILIEVMDLIYWKDMKRTGVLFTGLVVGLLSLFQLSIITVVSTLALIVLCFTISVRVYYHVLHALQWADSVHPFQWFLDYDISLTGEKADYCMRRTIVLTVSTIAEMKRLLFVANLVDSLKFLVVAYVLTYVGAIFNGLTVLIIGVISLFSIPLFYRQHQAQVDNFLETVKTHIDNIKDIFQRLCQAGSPASVHDPTPGGAKPKIK